jgi:hypothetical protein
MPLFVCSGFNPVAIMEKPVFQTWELHGFTNGMSVAGRLVVSITTQVPRGFAVRMRMSGLIRSLATGHISIRSPRSPGHAGSCLHVRALVV